MPQSVVFLTPAYDGKVHVFTIKSIREAEKALNSQGIATDWLTYPGCCYLPPSRNKLVDSFLKGQWTDMLFVDADIEFDPDAVFKVCKWDRDVVCGVYPFRAVQPDFPCKLKLDPDGFPAVDPHTGLIEADFIPTGFLRIRRKAFEDMERHYGRDSLLVKEYDNSGTLLGEYLNYFDTEHINHRWVGEDYCFSAKYRSISDKHKIWVDPNITFKHHGLHGFEGNFHDYLRTLPGGGGEKPDEWKF